MKRRRAPGTCSGRDERSRARASQRGSQTPTRLKPRRDTGITLTGARDRTSRLRRDRAAARLQIGIAVLLIAAALIAGWQLARDGQSAPAQATDAATVGPDPELIGVVGEDGADPTPLFGSYQDLHLYLPVSPEALTEIGYHQAAYDYAQPIVSLLPDADMVAATANHGTGRATAASTTDTGEDDGAPTLDGTVLRMWRSGRSGPPDTAVDVGAPPGTTVFAPVSGEVVAVKPYMLYDKHEDFEIHIRPVGWSEIDVVMIHLEDPTIDVGDYVVGGVTPIAQIRCLSDRVTHQLSAYTPGGGDHVHIQLNLVDSNGIPVGQDGS